MPSFADPLDEWLAPDSRHLCAEVWRGYVAHALLFYRQNRLRRFEDLARIGRRFSIAGGPPASSSAVDRAAALREVERGLRAAPRSHALYALRGLLRCERYWGSLRLGADSLEDFERARALEPRSAWAHLLAGMGLEMHRRYTRAIRCFDAATALRPRWSWPYVFRGVCQWYLAEFPAAIRELERAARLDPRGELPLLLLARAKSDVRDPSLIADLDRALKLAPRSGFAFCWRGRARFVLDGAPSALADLRRSIRLLPEYDRGYSWLGISFTELGRWRQAERLLETARRLNPYYPTSLYPLARALMRAGRWRRAGRVLREAARVDRDGVWVEHRISMSHQNRACLRSLADLETYLGRFPRSAWAWAWRGQTELLLRRDRAAAESLDRAARLSPRDPWVYLWRGELRRRRGDLIEARADFDRALALSPDLSWALAGRGFCLLGLGRARQAERELDRSLRLQPRCAPALTWRAQARFRLSLWRDAARDWEEALELHPRDQWIDRWLWRAKARAGDWAAAAAVLERLAGGEGAHSDKTWALLGWIHGRLGREELALKDLGRALRENDRQPLALLAVACWWARQGEKARASYVLSSALAAAPAALSERLARFARALPDHLPLGIVEDVLDASEDQAATLSADQMVFFARRRGRDVLSRVLKGDFRGAFERLEKRKDGLGLQDLLLRGWLVLRAGDPAEAVEWASRALDETLDPTSAAALWLRARAKSRLGQASAADDLRRLKSLYPSSRAAARETADAET